MSQIVEKLVSERAAASLLDLTPSALRKWRQQKRGPAFIRLSGRCVKYRVSDLENFLAERVITPRDASAESAHEARTQ